MSEETQRLFIAAVRDAMEPFLDALGECAAPSIDNAGFVTSATYALGTGRVELRCGPSEYRTELFVHLPNGDGTMVRLGLAELMYDPDVKRWIVQNRPHVASSSREDLLKAECTWCVELLRYLRGVRSFGTLTRTPHASS